MWNETIPLLAASANLLLGFLAIVNGPDRPLHRTFAALTGAFFIWNFGTFRLAATGDLFWHRFLTLGSALLPAVAFRFATFYLSLPEKLRTKLSRILFGLSGALSILTLTPLFMTEAFRITLTLYMIAVLLGISALIFARYRQTEIPIERHKLGYIVAALGIIVPATLLDAVRDFGLPVARLGNLASLFTAAILALAIVRHRLIDLEVVLRGSLIFAVLVVMAVPLHGLLYATQHAVSVGTVATEIFVLVLATAVIFPWTTRWAQTPLTRAVLGPRSGRRELLRSMRARSSAGDLGEEDLTAPLEEAREGIRARWIALISLSDDFTQARTTVAGELPTPLAPDAHALHAMAEVDGMLYRSEVVTAETSPEGVVAACVDAMEALHAELLVPLTVTRVPRGLLLAGPRANGTAYDALDVDFFEELAQEVRSVLQNAHSRRMLETRSRLEAVGEMSAGVAHEIRNPLASMKGAVELLFEGPAASDPSSRRILELLSTEAQRLERVVGDFLEYARPAEPELMPERLDEVVRRTLELLRQDPELRTIALEQKSPDVLPLLPLDAEQIRQVLINLIRNAAQAMEGNGRVTVETAEGVNEAILRVSDTGPGFSSEALRRGFDPFFTTRSRGSGLGLAIARRIVDNHGGRIQLRNRSPRGGEVIITLRAGLKGTPGDGQAGGGKGIAFGEGGRGEV
jgi:two-component system sensor histidine kinase HydH